jgi:multidrug efflux pump subunit AcrA (membrane-fusion protein)
MFGKFVGVVGLAVMLAACGGGRPPAAAPARTSLATVTVQPERMPIERRLDGVIEAVNQGTVGAQTSGRVAAILYDVNDFVPAGTVIIRLRSTELRVPPFPLIKSA